MRLLLFISDLSIGGAQRQLTLLAGGLKKRGVDVRVASLQRQGAFLGTLEELGIEVHGLGGSSAMRTPQVAHALTQLVRTTRTDVVYSLLPAANVLSSILRVTAPGCRLVWGMRSAELPLARFTGLSRTAYRLERALSFVPDLIISNSRRGRRDALAQGYPSEKMYVVRNGFDTEQFRPDSGAGRALRSFWGVPDEALLIGKIARVAPKKNHGSFIKAAARLAHKHPEVYFVAVGEGPEAAIAELKQLAYSNGLGERMIWAGRRDDMPSVMNACDIVTLTSVAEGFPNAIAEAMACGVPCVASDAGDTAELIAETGHVFAPMDTEGLVAAWEQLIDPMVRSNLGAAARQRIVEHFSVASLVDQTLKALDKA